MAALSTEGVRSEIAAGKGGGVYFLHGDETYLRDHAVDLLVDAYLDTGARDFNLDQLRGGEVEPETLASVTQTPPMMGEWRVVLVRDAQELTSSARHRRIVEELVDAPPPGLVLILVAAIPARSSAKFYQLLKKKARAHEFAALSDADAPGWLIERAHEHGLELEPEAARAMAAAMGPQLGPLSNELQKLVDYVGDRSTISRSDVEAVVGSVTRVDRWAWFDSVAERTFAQARSQLTDLLASGESGVGLLIGLGNHFLRLELAAIGGRNALEQELPPRQKWLARRVLAQARGWTVAQLQNGLEDMLRADWLLKSGGSTDEAVIDELLLRLQARAARDAAA